MSARIEITPLALSDIQQGIDYYNQQQKGLGARFEDIINSTFRKISIMPMSASYAYDRVRYKVVKSFPYIILYEVSEISVQILRVYNTHLSETDF